MIHGFSGPRAPAESKFYSVGIRAREQVLMCGDSSYLWYDLKTKVARQAPKPDEPLTY